MNIYPALRAHMGQWTYYIAKMNMQELANEVKFAYQVHHDHTLSEAIQRELSESRVKRDIVTYLANREDRFFGSIVVATLGGKPKFYPVRITDDERFEILKDQHIDEAFGVLTFSGDQEYYALDGQHRLRAIQAIVNREGPESENAPENFADEEISVIMIVLEEDKPAPGEEVSRTALMKCYRRLFSSLNRYAKATDKDTNIILDEDDAFAILTRRLITEHPFFQWPGRERESARIQTKGKNLKTTDPFFTSLQTLYNMNTIFLQSNWRSNSEDSVDRLLVSNAYEFAKWRPREEYLDDLFDELLIYWDGLLEAIPDLKANPQVMRIHDLDLSSVGGNQGSDHLFFWPIGQELLAKIVRRMLNIRLPDPAKPTRDSVANALKPLAKIDWELHRPPWIHFLLVPGRTGMWKMRDEDRTEVLKIAYRLIYWVLGIDDLAAEQIDELKLDWQMRLSPPQEEKARNEMWESIVKKRVEMTTTPP